MSLTPKQQQRLEALLGAFDQGAVQPEELIEAMDAIIEVVNSTGASILEKLQAAEAKADQATTSAKETLSREMATLRRAVEAVDKAKAAEITRLRGDFQSAISTVEAKIPELPDEVDLSDIYDTLVDLEKRYTDLSSLIVAENVRNSLEVLPEGEKLAIDAIEGLSAMLEELKTRPGGRTVSGGMTRVLVQQMIDAAGAGLPDQTGNSGKFLTTDGTEASWGTPAGSGDMEAATYDPQNIADDAFDRANHTGSQAISTVTDLQTTLDAKAADNAVVKLTGNQTVAGVKTFSSSPIVPAPTTDLQAATKKYVDDSVTAGGGYTDENAQDAVGGILGAEFSYDDATPAITLAAGGIDESKLDTSVNASLDLADSAVQPADIADFETTTELNTRDTANRSRSNHTGTQTASTISDFDTEVSNNTDVAANTAARHDAVTVTDSAEIDFTLNGQEITASLKAGSIDESKLDTSVNASLDLADSAIQPGDNISGLTNDSGFITDYTVTEGDVTAHQAALSITESQISDLGSYVESDPSGVTGADAITNMMSLTQAEYNAITPDADTVYYITDAS